MDKNLEAEVEPGYDRQSGVFGGNELGHCLIVTAGGEEHRIVNMSLNIFLKSCPFGGMVHEDFPCVCIAMLLLRVSEQLRPPNW